MSIGRFAIPLLLALAVMSAPSRSLAEKPCEDYSPTKQKRCETLWKQINAEAATELAQFGLSQLKRRQAGEISQEQHLRENMAFIKQSAEKRLKLLSERMGKE